MSKNETNAHTTYWWKFWLRYTLPDMAVIAGAMVALSMLSVWCFTTEPSILANWDKEVYCEYKGCHALHVRREEYPDGIRHAICKEHALAITHFGKGATNIGTPKEWMIKKQ